MNKLYSVAIGVFAVTLIAVCGPSRWPGRIRAKAAIGLDLGMRMVAEVVASAFGSGLSWKGTLGGKEVCHAFELFTEVTLGAVIEPGNRVSYTNDLCYEPFDLNDSYG